MANLIPDDPTRQLVFAKLREHVPGIDFTAVKLSALLIQLSQQTTQVFENHFARWNLSQGRFAILMLLFNLPENDWTPVKLAEASNVTKATVTGLLNNLSRDGHITRHQHPSDQRKTSLGLSESGEQFVRSMLPDHFGQMSQIYRGLSGPQIKQIIDSLELLQQAMMPADEAKFK